MIKIGIRQNLFYPSMLITSTFLRQIDSIIISKVIKFTEGTLKLTLIMFLSEILSGLIVFKINSKYLSKIITKNAFKHMNITLIRPRNEIKRPDNSFIIYIYIFLIAFFDFIEFIIKTLHLPKYNKKYEISGSLDTRLRSIVTISSAFFCYYLFKIPIHKHHKFSLLIIIICLVLIIILEYLGNLDKKLAILTEVFFYIFVDHLFNSFKDVIEKYLLEYDYVNPFQTLMVEGVFGFIFTCLYCTIENPFTHIKEKTKITEIIGLIICFIFYFIFSGGKNLYRLVTNKLFSPITKSLADSILDPLLITISYFSNEKDKREKLFVFIINVILSFILVFSASIYNELFVLFCFKLEENTYIEISQRAKINELNEIINEEDSSSDDDENNDETKEN